MKSFFSLASVCALTLAPLTYSKAELRVGFISTLSGGASIIGQHQINGWKLGLEHQGWRKNGDRFGGIPTSIFYGDDQVKPDIGLAEAQKMIFDKEVHVIAGIIWSNVLMAIQRYAVGNGVGIISTNAGASPMAGKECSPYFISTSWNNDETPEAMGRVMSDEKFRTVWLMAPNYQAGKDMLAGFRREYKGGGEVLGETLFKLNESDFQPEISRIKAERPDALFIFAPGAMGISFMKQWASSGAGDRIKLFTVFTVDNLTLEAIGRSAVGTFHTNFWSPDSPNPTNQKFVKDYLAKYGSRPSHFAAQSYDAANLLAAAVRSVKGNVDDVLGLMKAMRKVSYDSVRGPYKYNVNGFPIQNFYLRKVVAGSDGRPIIQTVGTVFTKHRDSYWQQCPSENRY